MNNVGRSESCLVPAEQRCPGQGTKTVAAEDTTVCGNARRLRVGVTRRDLPSHLPGGSPLDVARKMLGEVTALNRMQPWVWGSGGRDGFGRVEVPLRHPGGNTKSHSKERSALGI